MDLPRGCPHAANAALLAEGTVAEVVLPDGVPGMAVLGHEALKELIGHPDVAKNARHFTALREGRIPDGWPLRTFATVAGMVTSDGEEHRRLRSLTGKAFTARRVEALRPRVERLTAGLLDGMERVATATDDGVVDLRQHFALPLPLSVISELLGVDEEFRDRLHVLSNQVVSTDLGPEEVLAANREMVAVLGAVAASRTRQPGDDLTSALIAARDEEPDAGADGGDGGDGGDGHDEGREGVRDRLSEPELIGTMLVMIVAGHETTLNLITNAVRALLAHPDQLDLLRSGEADWADAAEETLRWDSPVSFFPFRYPTRDVTVDGTLIPRGTPVLAGFSAAGRDPAAYGPDADRFDVTRGDRARRDVRGDRSGRGRFTTRHLSLGHGTHYCLGAPLARLETTIALRQLFTRFPGLSLAVPEQELPYNPSFVSNSVRELPVRLR
ncbi:cytochrome P450 [Streptomyces sp. NPDC088400]|uniref:cytochrome P450 family protein n=1 Tax=Streptomyces sp. NPDC088400 TaxID=3365861 RepID=UPI00380B07A8